jgi:hypothetical protein
MIDSRQHSPRIALQPFALLLAASLPLGCVAETASPESVTEAQQATTGAPLVLGGAACGDVVNLKSWKGDYLHRPDTTYGVTTWSATVGSRWVVDCPAPGTIMLRSWKGDYLHRPDSDSGVTTWGPTLGSQWTVQDAGNGTVMLRSWKGDYLHRPDSPSGVTTWGPTLGSQWTVELPLAHVDLNTVAQWFAPVVYLHPSETYLPDNVEHYRDNVELHVGVMHSAEDDYDNFDLVDLGHYGPSTVSALGLAQSESALRSWAAGQPQASGASVKVWTQIPADRQGLKNGDLAHAKTYVNLVQSPTNPSVVTFQYWYFYGYNGPGRFRVCLSGNSCDSFQIATIGRHEGDWEHVDVDVDLDMYLAKEVRLSRHKDDVPYSPSQLQWQGSRPVVYAAYYSHAFYPGADVYYYERPWSKDYLIGTASVDLYDLTGGGAVIPLQLQVVGSNVPGFAVTQPEWAKYTDRWGKYEKLSHTHTVDYVVGTYSYTQTEVGAGPRRSF